MAFAEPFDVYLSDFGQDATLDGVSVRVLLDDGYADGMEDVMGMGGMSGRRLVAGLPTADAASAASSSLLVIGGSRYRVASVQPDGTGWTLLHLHSAVSA